MPYVIIVKVRKFQQSTINRFVTAGKKPVGGAPSLNGAKGGFDTEESCNKKVIIIMQIKME